MGAGIGVGQAAPLIGLLRQQLKTGSWAGAPETEAKHEAQGASSSSLRPVLGTEAGKDSRPQLAGGDGSEFSAAGQLQLRNGVSL